MHLARDKCIRSCFFRQWVDSEGIQGTCMGNDTVEDLRRHTVEMDRRKYGRNHAGSH